MTFEVLLSSMTSPGLKNISRVSMAVELLDFRCFFQLTSNIILQLLQGPIWENTCRMRASVTSLERFPTYLKTQRSTAIWETRSMRRVFPPPLKLAAHSRGFISATFSAHESQQLTWYKSSIYEENPRIVNWLRLNRGFTPEKSVRKAIWGI